MEKRVCTRCLLRDMIEAGDMHPPGVQTWKRHGIRCKICLEEIHTFFSTEWFRLIFIPEPVSAFTFI